MTGLIGDGNIRVAFVPHVQDPAAPTPAELAAGVDAGIDFAGIAPELECVECDGAPTIPVFPSRERYFTVTLHNVRFSRRTVRKIQRAIARQLRDPKAIAMRADYARRRKARNRRRR